MFPLSLPWRLLVIAALAASAFAGGMGLMYRLESPKIELLRSQFADFRGQVSTQGREQAARIKKVKAASEATNAQTVDSYQNRIRDIERYYARRLRSANAIRSSPESMPAVSHAAACTNESAAHAIPVAANTPFGKSCTETTQQLNSLQAWVRKQAANWGYTDVSELPQASGPAQIQGK